MSENQHQQREDSCFLCQALPAGAADDSMIELKAPDVEADMEGDVESGEFIDHEFHHLPKRADCYACAQARSLHGGAIQRCENVRLRGDIPSWVTTSPQRI